MQATASCLVYAFCSSTDTTGLVEDIGPCSTLIYTPLQTRVNIVWLAGPTRGWADIGIFISLSVQLPRLREQFPHLG